MAMITLQDVLSGRVNIQEVMKDPATFQRISAEMKAQQAAIKDAAKVAGIKLAKEKVSKAKRYEDADMAVLNVAGLIFIDENIETIRKIATREDSGQYVAFTDPDGRSYQLLFKDLGKAAKAQEGRAAKIAAEKAAKEAAKAK